MKFIIKSALAITTMIIMTNGCVTKPDTESPIKKIDMQGHRGARGLMPENTIPGFIKALDLGVSTLEMDLAITKDGEVIVSHEPWISSEICQLEDGVDITNDSLGLNIYQMSYEQIKQYDCGTKPHLRFPNQQKMVVAKPRLRDVIETVEEYASKHLVKGFRYNIEIKSMPDGDEIFHPNPADFSVKVYQLLDSLLDIDRVTIQSFDFRVLQYYRQNYPQVELAVLIENKDSWQENIEKLGFVPAIFSPDFKTLDEQSILQLQAKGMKVIPWTVNEGKDIEDLISWGVDGIITDYPNIAVDLINKQ
ncbi:MAG: glycerophosphoryl diester phosphodiesterase [Cyclobacteriaceae bacterium]|jgi:glycerophosphoryl diester phosphodiesterase